MSTTTRITVAQYDAMIAEGVFDDPEDVRRLELIEGEIVEMSPIGLPHETPIDHFVRWSYLEGPAQAILVRVQQSLGIPEFDSVPQPDLAWIPLRAYKVRPGARDVLLLVEVADSSLSYDRNRKSRVYASAGIADYWIVDVKKRRVEVRREPEGDIFRSIRTYGPGESIPILAFPGLAFPVAVLFPV